MPLVVTNSLSRKKEPFQPMVAGRVSLYVCGPTVYGYTHVGNARPVVFFDVVRRFLRFSGYDVLFVSNYTDVDDKIINRARAESTTSSEITRQYIEAFEADKRALKVEDPDVIPLVTTHIAEIIALIERLIEKGAAYTAENGEVFFSVRKFSEYGKLSGKKIDDLLAGARVEADEKKKDPLDFSLWKPRKQADEPAWESPWGLGRPGWHIECSAMAMKYLGETFDIHGGGLDLIHPHHENEIAQSEACSQKPLARYWLHNNMVSIGSEKMSKSIGNIFYNRDFIRQFTAEVLRYLLLSSHYRSLVDFSEKHIRDCQIAIHRVYSTLEKCTALISTPATADQTPGEEEKKMALEGKAFRSRWIEAMEDDFNTAKVVSYVFDYVRSVNATIDKKGYKHTLSSHDQVSFFLSQMKELGQVLNLFLESPTTYLDMLRDTVLLERGITRAWIDQKIQGRIDARTAKDYASADSIRKECSEKGIELKDTASKTTWDVF